MSSRLSDLDIEAKADEEINDVVNKRVDEKWAKEYPDMLRRDLAKKVREYRAEIIHLKTKINDLSEIIETERKKRRRKIKIGEKNAN